MESQDKSQIGRLAEQQDKQNKEDTQQSLDSWKRQVYPQVKKVIDLGHIGIGSGENGRPNLNDCIPFFMYESIERQEQIAAQMKKHLVSLQSVSAEMKDALGKMHWHSRLMIWLTVALLVATVALIALTIVLICRA